MSFILDALKKADSERRLGEVPGIHSRTLPTAGLPVHTGLLQRRSAWTIVALVILALAAWTSSQYWATRGTADHTSVQLKRSLVDNAVVQPPTSAQPPVVSTRPVAPATVVVSDIPVPPPLAAPLAQPATPAKLADKPAAPSPVINLVTDLPSNLQSEIPKLAIAGSIYSANPAERMLLIDKRMLREGEEISPGLVLETVMPKAATLRYKGYAFRVVF